MHWAHHRKHVLSRRISSRTAAFLQCSRKLTMLRQVTSSQSTIFKATSIHCVQPTPTSQKRVFYVGRGRPQSETATVGSKFQHVGDARMPSECRPFSFKTKVLARSTRICWQQGHRTASLPEKTGQTTSRRLSVGTITQARKTQNLANADSPGVVRTEAARFA